MGIIIDLIFFICIFNNSFENNYLIKYNINNNKIILSVIYIINQ